MPNTRPTIVTLLIAAALMFAACSAQPSNSGPPYLASASTASSSVRASAVPSQSPDPTVGSSVGASMVPSESPQDSPRHCLAFFTPAPYDSFRPVPGVAVRAINKGRFEITNGTSLTYYGGVTTWVTEDDLVCGRGVIGHDSLVGRIAPGATVDWSGGSTADVPLTVAIWDSPCGEGCYRTPVGAYVVPISSVEPVPLST